MVLTTSGDAYLRNRIVVNTCSKDMGAKPCTSTPTSNLVVSGTRRLPWECPCRCHDPWCALFHVSNG
ncbi:hypothetical protein [Kineococcus sp. SYSU DK002]|uniref:hypothetical protein n=1 Tax=Kineococcus sp. SYSU DK002 TaxID=3383123 RepID=UPI003D7D8157